MGQLEDDLQSVFANAPELRDSPELAVAATNSADPRSAAQAISQVADNAATHQANQQMAKHHGGWWYDVVNTLINAQSPVGKFLTGQESIGKSGAEALQASAAAANAPLREVQHQYRYLRDVKRDKGMGPFLAESLGVAAGAVGGFALGRTRGAVLGAEAAAGLEGRLTYTDTWNKSATDSGSPGRDLLGHSGFWAGAVDGLFDLGADPLAKGLGFAAAGRTAEGAGGILGSRLFPGIAIDRGVEGVDAAARRSLSYNLAVKQIAGLDKKGILRYFPKLEPIADDLAQAGTPEAVHQVFRDLAAAADLSRPIAALPTLTLGRKAFQSVSMMRSDGILDKMQKLFETYSQKPVNLGDNLAPERARQLARLGFTNRTADMVADSVENAVDANGNPDIGARRAILRNLVKSVIVAKAKEDPENLTPKQIADMSRVIDRLTDTGAQKYGVDLYGGDISSAAVDESGREEALGIRVGQVTDEFKMPNFHALNRAAAWLKGYREIFGQEATRSAAGDWISAHITQPWRGLVMTNPATAVRISLNELLPEVARQGLNKIVGGALARTYAKWGIQAEKGELGRLSGVVYEALGGDEGALANSKRVQFATRLQLSQDTHGELPPEIQAGHAGGATDNPLVEKKIIHLNKEAQTSAGAKRLTPTGTYEWIPGTNDNATIPWHANLQEAFDDPATRQAAAPAFRETWERTGDVDEARRAGANAAARYIENHPGIYKPGVFMRHGNEFNGMPWADHWGMITSEAMLGDGVGYLRADGTIGVNEEILAALAEGSRSAFEAGQPLSKSYLDSLPVDMRPKMIKSERLVPYTGNILNRVSAVGWRKVMNPIINHLARIPIFNSEAYDQYLAFEPQIKAGLMDEDTALVQAKINASAEMVKRIHNPMERSQLGYAMRNFAPFYYAQEQAFRRMGRLLETDPAAFRRYQLAQTAMVNLAHSRTDPNGNSYVVIPGSGFIDDGFLEVASAIGIKLDNRVASDLSGSFLNMGTVFPMVEDPVPWHRPGPIVTIPAHVLDSLRPEMGPITSAVVGPRSASGTMFDQLMPNAFVRNAIKATGLNKDWQYSNTVSALQFMAHNGDLTQPAPGEDQDHFRQRIVDRARHTAMVLDGVKALVGLISPGSPKVTIGRQFSDLANSYIKKYGDIATAMQAMTKDHPDMTAYTVFKSKGVVSPTDKAQAWLDQNSGWASRHAGIAAYFVPQGKGDAYSQSAWNAQMAQGLRIKKAPDEILDEIYAAEGNNLFFGVDLPAHKAALKAVQNDPAARARENKKWNNYITQVFGPTHPIWWAQFRDPARQQAKQQKISDLIRTFAEKDLPESGQTQAVAGLLNDWAVHQLYLKPGQALTISQAQKTAESTKWQNYLVELARDNPGLTMIINALFRDPGQAEVSAA